MPDFRVEIIWSDDELANNSELIRLVKAFRNRDWFSSPSGRHRISTIIPPDLPGDVDDQKRQWSHLVTNSARVVPTLQHFWGRESDTSETLRLWIADIQWESPKGPTAGLKHLREAYALDLPLGPVPAVISDFAIVLSQCTGLNQTLEELRGRKILNKHWYQHALPTIEQLTHTIGSLVDDSRG